MNRSIPPYSVATTSVGCAKIRWKAILQNIDGNRWDFCFFIDWMSPIWRMTLSTSRMLPRLFRAPTLQPPDSSGAFTRSRSPSVASPLTGALPQRVCVMDYSWNEGSIAASTTLQSNYWIAIRTASWLLMSVCAYGSLPVPL